MRLGKYLATAGAASRRGSEDLIRAGRVTVDGAVVRDPARDVGEEAAVALDGTPLEAERKEYYAVHKPLGVISAAADTHDRPIVTELVPTAARLYPVGRLDADTSGLLILTNDGDLAERLMHPRYEVPKMYEADVAGAVGEQALATLRRGVPLEDGLTAPASVRVGRRARSRTRLQITLHEGRNRQVRRMLEAVGHRVQSLRRVSVGPLKLGHLPAGGYRKLSRTDVAALRQIGKA